MRYYYGLSRKAPAIVVFCAVRIMCSCHAAWRRGARGGTIDDTCRDDEKLKI